MRINNRPLPTSPAQVSASERSNILKLIGNEKAASTNNKSPVNSRDVFEPQANNSARRPIFIISQIDTAASAFNKPLFPKPIYIIPPQNPLDGVLSLSTQNPPGGKLNKPIYIIPPQNPLDGISSFSNDSARKKPIYIIAADYGTNKPGPNRPIYILPPNKPIFILPPFMKK